MTNRPAASATRERPRLFDSPTDTAGASAPEVLVQAVIDRLKSLGAASVRALEGVEENVTFPLPKGLDGVRADLA